MYTHVSFSMTEALNHQIPQAKFAFLPPFNAIWKTMLLLMLCLFFTILFFYFKLYKISPDPTPVVI